MTGDKTERRDLDAVADDDPTADLEVLSEADIAALEAKEQLEAKTDSRRIDAAQFEVLRDVFDESWPTSRAELEVRTEITALQSEIERLRSDAIELNRETRAFKELRDKIADELKEATRKNAEMTELLSQRNDELAALKSVLAAKASTGDKVAGHAEAAAEETQPCALPQREFDPGETRKLVGHGQYASREFAIRPGQMRLGSAVDNDIQIKDEFISRHHAQILSNSRETILRDMSSTNGTYVNSRRINKCALHDGDSITIGKLSFTFVRQRKTATAFRPVAQTPWSEHSARSNRESWR